MQAKKVGLRKVRDLEDMIGRGTEITPIERPYMKLADDPRVLAYSDLDAASFAQLELRLAAARRFRPPSTRAMLRCTGGTSANATVALKTDMAKVLHVPAVRCIAGTAPTVNPANHTNMYMPANLAPTLV